jgi:hypothetical protein
MNSFLYVSAVLLARLQQSMPLSSNKKWNSIRLWLKTLVLTPILLAVWIAGTRIEDYWHR